MALLVLYFSLVLARVGAFVGVLPLFGTTPVPRLVRVGLAFSLTLLYMGNLFPALPAGKLADQAATLSWAIFGLGLAREAVLGALLGFAFGLLLAPARVAGEFITQSLGLGFGAQVSPAGDRPAGPLTLIFEAMAVFLFLGLDGHHLPFAILHSTFVAYPVGSAIPQVPVQNLVSGLAAAEEYGLVLAAPVVMCLVLSLVLLVLLNRTAPQFNLYSVGFPLQLAVGIAAMWLLWPNLVRGLAAVFQRISAIISMHMG
jgi:flagellar biosynthetic protein FliR